MRPMNNVQQSLCSTSGSVFHMLRVLRASARCDFVETCVSMLLTALYMIAISVFELEFLNRSNARTMPHGSSWIWLPFTAPFFAFASTVFGLLALGAVRYQGRSPSADHNDIAPHRARVAYQLQHTLLMLSLASAFGGFFFYHMSSHAVRPNLPPHTLQISALDAPLALVQPRAQACR